MSGDNPTLKDIWRLLGTMNKRFDGLERQIVQVRADLTQQIVGTNSDLAALRAEMRLGFGALKEAIEARDFRLDDQARRISRLENPNT